ncbi:hypothetical protein DAPPUDRAFT_341203 [Daphnia pulex]|uniref:Uncharacterized protein n=1 Tax=Daphnia pulex TaxID=6669 RepID=E9I594_DAPPU|nr:hypothetical protein DAPPUDRAFT_341203 [Daphnia pulex]|eukprot:EFX60836.1 hypothetical protein DAPPUDRAFT_341203 [Daphnia pulex]
MKVYQRQKILDQMLKLATTRVSSKLSCVLMESDLFAFRLTESYQFVSSRKIKGQHHGQKRVFVDHAQTCHYSCIIQAFIFAFRLTESYQFVPSRKIKGQHHGQKRVFVDHAQTCHYSCIIQAFMCVDGKRSICI